MSALAVQRAGADLRLGRAPSTARLAAAAAIGALAGPVCLGLRGEAYGLRLRAAGCQGSRVRNHAAQEEHSVSDRPFRVLGIQQIAVGGLDKSKLRRIWVDTLGLTVAGNFKSERENVDEDIAQAGSGPLKVEVDLMQPIDPEKKPKVQDPALNHVGLWIDDLHAAVPWLEKQGVRFTPGGIRKGASGFDVCFIHPKGNEESPVCGEGVLIELVQAPPEVTAAFDKMAAA